ncbi:MAG: glutathione S-transferase [Gammaproteobacteria bacterium]|nr:glutathione S-transferase [Gammaproteobacteria bacterium]
MLPITALYAALLLAVFVALSALVGRQRGRANVAILHGDDMDLAVAIRRHGNFVEYVPFALVLMALIEANGGSALFLHVVGILLVACRIAHPFGLQHDKGATPLRAVGAGGTLLLLLALGAMALWQSLTMLASG